MTIELYKTFKPVRPEMGMILGTCGGKSAHEIRLENEIKRRQIHAQQPEQREWQSRSNKGAKPASQMGSPPSL